MNKIDLRLTRQVVWIQKSLNTKLTKLETTRNSIKIKLLGELSPDARQISLWALEDTENFIQEARQLLQMIVAEVSEDDMAHIMARAMFCLQNKKHPSRFVM